MGFHKTGDVIKIETIYCPCGGEIDKNTQKCLKCSKDHLPENENNDNKPKN